MKRKNESIESLEARLRKAQAELALIGDGFYAAKGLKVQIGQLKARLAKLGRSVTQDAYSRGEDN
jgi:hypothetical protein